MRRMTRTGILFFLIFLIACSSRSLRNIPELNTLQPPSADTPSGATPAVQVQYLGTGGMLLRHDDQILMIDPFFSNPSFLRIGKSILAGGKIRSRPRAIQFAHQRVIDSLRISPEKLRDETRAIFIAHGHYDHAMDVPFLFHRWFDRKPNVFGNHSIFNAFADIIPAGNRVDLEPLMSVREAPGQAIRFVSSTGTTLNVYPILGNHNPQAYHVRFFSGSHHESLKRLKTPEDKTNVNDWLEGRTLSFLIDLEKEGKVFYRIFIQSSSCAFPDGVPPSSMLAVRDVDLAILGVASYAYSEATYPCEYLKTLKAKRALFIHWEDFFRRYHKKPKTVRRTDVKAFVAKVQTECAPQEFFLPLPGSVYTVKE